jgi:hypothetical protein
MVRRLNPDGSVFTWTDGMVDYLREASAAGLNPREMADELAAMIGMPVTHLQIIAKCKHHKLPFAEYEKAPKKRPRTEAVRRGPKPAYSDRFTLGPILPAPVVAYVPENEPKPRRLTLFELKSQDCRMPLWGDRDRLPVEQQFYCGLPQRAGSSYCRWCFPATRQGDGRVVRIPGVGYRRVPFGTPLEREARERIEEKERAWSESRSGIGERALVAREVLDEDAA